MADQSVTISHEYLIILKCNGHNCLLHLHAYVSYGVFLSVFLEAPVLQQIAVGRRHQSQSFFRLCAADIDTVNTIGRAQARHSSSQTLKAGGQ